MKIAIMGGPLSGRSTQARRIGDYLAAEAGNDDLFPEIQLDDVLADAGLPTHAALSTTGWDDDEVVALVRKRLTAKDCARGFVLDGFPFTEGQFLRMRRYDALRFDAVFILHLSDDAVLARGLGRRRHLEREYHLQTRPPRQAGLDDDTGDVLLHHPLDTDAHLRRRLQFYHAFTEPLLTPWFMDMPADRFSRVHLALDGTLPIDDLHGRLRRGVAAWERNKRAFLAL